MHPPRPATLPRSSGCYASSFPPIPSSRAKPPKGRRSRGTSSCGSAFKKVPPLRLASLGFGRDDGLSKTHVQSLIKGVLVDHVRPGALDLLVGHLMHVDVEDGHPEVLLHRLLLHQRVVT